MRCWNIISNGAGLWSLRLEDICFLWIMFHTLLSRIECPENTLPSENGALAEAEAVV